MVEVEMGVDDDVDAGEIEVLLAQWAQTRIDVGHQRVKLSHARCRRARAIGMVDDVHVDRHPLAVARRSATRTGVTVIEAAVFIDRFLERYGLALAPDGFGWTTASTFRLGSMNHAAHE